MFKTTAAKLTYRSGIEDYNIVFRLF